MENDHAENQNAEEQSIEVRRGCARGGETEKEKRVPHCVNQRASEPQLIR
jgi:hypothetical protein